MFSQHNSTINASAIAPTHPLHWAALRFAFSSNDDNFDYSHYEIWYNNPFTILFVILAAVILSMICLLIYSRGFWCFRARQTAASQAPPQPRPPPARQLGLYPAVIDSLPVIFHRATTGENPEDAECCICLSVFQNGEKVKVLPECRHSFHSHCVDKWLKTHRTCPLYRVSLQFGSPV